MMDIEEIMLQYNAYPWGCREFFCTSGISQLSRMWVCNLGVFPNSFHFKCVHSCVLLLYLKQKKHRCHLTAGSSMEWKHSDTALCSMSYRPWAHTRQLLFFSIFTCFLAWSPTQSSEGRKSPKISWITFPHTSACPSLSTYCWSRPFLLSFRVSYPSLGVSLGGDLTDLLQVQKPKEGSSWCACICMQPRRHS